MWRRGYVPCEGIRFCYSYTEEGFSPIRHFHENVVNYLIIIQAVRVLSEAHCHSQQGREDRLAQGGRRGIVGTQEYRGRSMAGGHGGADSRFNLGGLVKDMLTGGIVGGLGSAGFYGAGKAVEAFRESLAGRRNSVNSEISRVGRWMSREEYQKMIKTGYVQKPYNAEQSYVVYPADYNAYYKQASKGSVYVEFNVPSESLKQTKDMWTAILEPNSMYSKLNVRKGLQPFTFPKVTNIVVVGEK